MNYHHVSHQCKTYLTKNKGNVTNVEIKRLEKSQWGCNSCTIKLILNTDRADIYYFQPKFM